MRPTAPPADHVAPGVPVSADIREPDAPGAIREGLRIEVAGVVQGVGFRPFVYRLARDLALDGTVRNAAGRVEIEVGGDAAALEAFVARLRADAPPRSRVERLDVVPLEHAPTEGAGFVILESVSAASVERLFPPDIATCDDCLREVFDPADRRYRYPFTNCTNCGPRATIIEELPYDRSRTSMAEFPLCPECAAEYRDPLDRRFHAEPVACPACGPRLSYRRSGSAASTASGEDALAAAVCDIRAGKVVAIKGLGGYHLACDATDGAAVIRLRDRKRRWAKPFAVMVRDLETARGVARIARSEEALLTSPARPIVLAPLRASARQEPRIAPEVTTGNRRIGLFLPYTPLHHLLLAEVGRPIVLTSGNLSDEPLVTDDDEALVRLAGLADSFLQHDRRIRARYDDSVTRVVGGGGRRRESIVRRARGYAPEPLGLPVAVPHDATLLAVGAELKHTFALARGGRAHVAPHVGDLEDLATHEAFEWNLAHLERLLAFEPGWAAHDLHPAYLSTQYARGRFTPDRLIAVQHHHAHVASCAAEHGLTGPFIGVAYDGLGMGDDGTFWGGEILVADLVSYRRIGRFGAAPMPGGALAVRKPYRMALGYLFGAEALEGGAAGGRLDPDVALELRDAPEDSAGAFLARLDPREVAIVRTQVRRGLNAPLATSAGRLFDAAASLIGLRDVAEFEAQAAIDLEMAAVATETAALRYRLVRHDGLLVYDPRPTLADIVDGTASGIGAGRLAARFQATIAEVTQELCTDARIQTGLRTICLSGGVFQNRWLANRLLDRLASDGFEVHINERVPVNDGGICFGQAAVAAARMAGTTSASVTTAASATPGRV